jgi:predicted dehydrogenase
MKVGIIGTGAIAAKHAQAYRNIGFDLVACANQTAERGRAFARDYGARFIESPEALCASSEIELVDLCTPPGSRLRFVEEAARHGKHVLVEKPIAIDLPAARRMIDATDAAGVQLGVVSQHRFDDSIQFLKRAMADDRLGRLLAADAYVKWYRSPEYYSRRVKGSWLGEGGGALINQAIHQLDMLLYLVGPVRRVTGQWRLGALHAIESEDVLNTLLEFESGTLGVLQASTAYWPGAPERLELHGVKGTGVVVGDKLTGWAVKDDHGAAPPVAAAESSGASDPMAISSLPLERQMMDFAECCASGRVPLSSGRDGYRALETVLAIYESCRSGQPVSIDAAEV